MSKEKELNTIAGDNGIGVNKVILEAIDSYLSHKKRVKKEKYPDPDKKKRMTVGEFPLYPEQMKKLIESHKSLEEQPLYLSIWYNKDDKKNLYLFEVIGNFPHSLEDDEVFTMEFSSTSEFLIALNGKLVLTLVGPEEAREAIKNKLSIIQKIKASFQRNSAQEMYCQTGYEDILQKLKYE